MKKILLIAASLGMLSSEAALRLKVGVFGGFQISKIKDETNLTTHNIGNKLATRFNENETGTPDPLFADETVGELDKGYSAKGGALFDIRMLKMDHFSLGFIGQIGYGNINGLKKLPHSEVSINSSKLDPFVGVYAKYSFSSSFKMGVGYGISFLTLKYEGKLSNIDDIKAKAHQNTTLLTKIDALKDKTVTAETKLAIGHKFMTFLEYKHSKELSLLLIGDFLFGNANVDGKVEEIKTLFSKDKTKSCFMAGSVSLGLVYKLA